MDIKNKMKHNYVTAVLLSFIQDWRGKDRHKIEQAIEKYKPDITGKRAYTHLRRDIIFSRMMYGINAEEYFRYGFQRLSDKGRKEYVGESELKKGFISLESPETFKLFRNKYNAYEFFKSFYDREVIMITDKDDLSEKLSSFLSRHTSFIVKPVEAFGGEGVELFDSEDESCEELIERIKKKVPCIIEERIIQAPEMAKFHPQSVNTVRIVTSMGNNNVEIKLASVRMGTGNSVVDNGCLSAAVDINSGIITTYGRNAHGKGLYLFHPDTNEQILGSEIPRWNEVCNLALRLSKMVPSQKIIGWDMALSVNGWVVVEGNTHPQIQILAGDGIGVRSIFESMVNKQ